MLSRVEGLEKAVAELTAHVRSLDTSLDERILRSLEPVLRELCGPRIGETIPETHPDMSRDPVSDPDASSPIPTSGTPPAMALPSFDGTDALGWLARAGQYFMVNKTPDASRMDLALIALSGPALPWIQILRRSYEALAATKQDGSVADYIASFESHLAQLPDLTDNQLLSFFLAKLKPHIRLQLSDPTTYSDAVKMAKRIERMSTPLTYPIKNDSVPNSGTPNSTFSHSDSASSFPLSSGQRPNHRFRNMSQEEYNKHRAAGTCFQCGLNRSLYPFAAVENGSSPAVSIYLQRTSDAFNRLVQYHSKTKNTITFDSVTEIENEIINDVESDGHATAAAKSKKTENSGSKKSKIDS
ncbi:hypothetical protein SASPL_157062 [Salvia splendens]|uniref:Retrotransposon gag domain-containing protein n=1 Tax=Salvia splendens TaxID=180675 RepID=A0A8X8VVS5_SALSN|nr:hypothetical protein SASPL_157062 [Salvia splendens]